VLLITDPALSVNNPNNLTHTARHDVHGQFMTMTDVRPDLGARVPTDPEESPNGAHARFRLDSVYGGGPPPVSELYEPSSRIKFRIESGGLFEDLPRASDNAAIIVDPRNDEHVIIAGLHAGVPLFHNKAVDHVSRHRPRMHAEEVFEEARRLTTGIPLDDRSRVPAAHSSVGSYGGNPPPWRKFYPASRGVMPVEFQGRLSLGPFHGAASYGRTSPATTASPSSRWSSTRPGQARRTRSTCAAAPRPAALHRLADLLRLRRRQREAEQRSTRGSRRRYSTSRSPRSLRTSLHLRCRSATCCAR